MALITVVKRGTTDAGDGVGDFDGGEMGALVKRPIPDACDGVSRTVVSDGRRDNCGRKSGRTIGYFAGLILVREDVIIEAFILKTGGEHRLRREEEEREEGD